MDDDPDIPDDEMAMVMTEVDEMVEDYGPDFFRLADEVEKGLVVGGLDPDDPPFWRAVARELRRRAADAKRLH